MQSSRLAALIRAFLLGKLHERWRPGLEGAGPTRAGGHSLRTAQINRSKFLHAWMRRCTVLEYSGQYGERDGLSRLDLVSYFPHLMSIDFSNQPFNLRPESWERVLHNIPDNFPVNTKIVMN